MFLLINLKVSVNWLSTYTLEKWYVREVLPMCTVYDLRPVNLASLKLIPIPVLKLDCCFLQETKICFNCCIIAGVLTELF